MTVSTPTTPDVRFACMGGNVRLMSTDTDAAEKLEAAREWLCDAALRLSRFEPDSELNALNADPRETVPVSPLMRAAVRAMLRAAELSGGLVDPTLLDALEDAGYRESRRDRAPLPLTQALRVAPERAPARPRSVPRWREIRVDDRAGTVTRPVGMRLDTGGSTKGMLADILARQLWELGRVAIDCAGDVRITGRETRLQPMEVEVVNPLTQGVSARLWLGDGAIATSGLDRNVWRTPGGGAAHHLLDPSTGHPAWTGLIGATAIAPTALEAETLAKSALLSGPAAARRMLTPGGGVIVFEDGRAEGLGALAELVR